MRGEAVVPLTGDLMTVVLSSGVHSVSIDNSRPDGDESPMALADKEVDASVAEGLRLVVAFKKIKRRTDRLTVIDLAERLGD